ncbi:hypothetical protein ACVV2G_27170 [Streptomyces ziwulingensis]
MSRRRYSSVAPLPVRIERLLATAEPSPEMVRAVLREHPDAAKLYSEDAADWLTDREFSPPFSVTGDEAEVSAEVNRDHAIDGWLRGIVEGNLSRSPLYSARMIGFGIPPLESSVLHLPRLRWSARCVERQRELST